MKIDNRHSNRVWKESTTWEGKQQTERVIQTTEGTKRYYETVLWIRDMLVVGTDPNPRIRTNNDGSGSGRPENIRFRNHNTVMEDEQHTEKQTVEGKQQEDSQETEGIKKQTMDGRQPTEEQTLEGKYE